MMRRALLAAAVAALTLLGAATASARAPFHPERRSAAASAASGSYALPPAARGHTQKLSDERLVSRWAYVEAPVWARTAPSPGARHVHRLSDVTADGTPELVLTLARRRLGDGSQWVLVRLPMRPNNRVAWVPRSVLSTFRVVTTKLRISRHSLRATLFRRGHVVWQARVGIGKASTPTPAGHFYVRERLVAGNPRGTYGPYAFGTSAYSVLSDWPGGGVVGIHGTNQPDLVPGHPSHGCVRVRNAPVRQLWRLMPLGTPIEIG